MNNIIKQILRTAGILSLSLILFLPITTLGQADTELSCNKNERWYHTVEVITAEEGETLQAKIGSRVAAFEDKRWTVGGLAIHGDIAIIIIKKPAA